MGKTGIGKTGIGRGGSSGYLGPMPLKVFKLIITSTSELDMVIECSQQEDLLLPLANFWISEEG